MELQRSALKKVCPSPSVTYAAKIEAVQEHISLMSKAARVSRKQSIFRNYRPQQGTSNFENWEVALEEMKKVKADFEETAKKERGEVEKAFKKAWT